MENSSTFGIFVSHSHADNDFGIKLVKDLNRMFSNEINIWYDANGGLQVGDIWWSKILKALEESSVFLIILSPNSMTSSWVNMEINIMWNMLNSEHEHKIIIPILYRNCNVRSDLKTVHIISFLNSQAYTSSLDELIRKIQKFKKTSTAHTKQIQDKSTNFFTKSERIAARSQMQHYGQHRSSSLSRYRNRAIRIARLEAIDASRDEIEILPSSPKNNNKNLYKAAEDDSLEE